MSELTRRYSDYAQKLVVAETKAQVYRTGLIRLAARAGVHEAPPDPALGVEEYRLWITAVLAAVERAQAGRPSASGKGWAQ